MTDVQQYLCPVCGAVLSPGSISCPRCGLQLDDASRKARIEQQLKQPMPYISSPQPPVPAADSSIPSSQAAASFTASPRQPMPGKKILAISSTVLFAFILLISIVVSVADSGMNGYNASPEKLVEGLDRALRESDRDLLLSLIPEQERDGYDRSRPLAVSRTKVTLEDVIIGEREQFAMIIVNTSSLPSYQDHSDAEGSMQMLMAEKIDGAWFFYEPSLRSYCYLY